MEDTHRHRMQPLPFTAPSSFRRRGTVSTAVAGLEIGNKRITFAALAKFIYASANAFAPIMQMFDNALFIHAVASFQHHCGRVRDFVESGGLALEASRPRRVKPQY